MQFDLTRMSGQVADMNTAFGNPRGDRLVPDWDHLERQYDLIRHELEELGKELKARNMRGMRDGGCDVLVTALGLYHLMGYNSEADMIAVYLSNMSKFCKTEEEIVATEAKYAAIGLSTYREGEFPRMYLKAAHDYEDAAGNKYKKGKFLKGINFKEPVFL